MFPIKVTPSYSDAKQHLLSGALQDLAIMDEGWEADDTHNTSCCQLVTNIASRCTRLKTLAISFGQSCMSSDHAGDAFPAAVSRLTALESLALQGLVLSVRDLPCDIHVCSICNSAQAPCTHPCTASLG
jgi:hypothetical protein